MRRVKIPKGARIIDYRPLPERSPENLPRLVDGKPPANFMPAQREEHPIRKRRRERLLAGIAPVRSFKPKARRKVKPNPGEKA